MKMIPFIMFLLVSSQQFSFAQKKGDVSYEVLGDKTRRKKVVVRVKRDGTIVSKLYWGEEGKHLFRKVYERFDNNGYLIYEWQKVRMFSFDAANTHFSYQYDSLGRQIEAIQYSDFLCFYKPYDKRETFYDKQGNKSIYKGYYWKKKQWILDGVHCGGFGFRYIYLWDIKEYRVKEVWEGKYKYNMTYDENGNLIEEEWKKNGNIVTKEEFEAKSKKYTICKPEDFLN